MRPLRTASSDTTFVGPPGVDPLPIETLVELLPDGSPTRVLRSRWRPSDEERLALAGGADIVLDVLGPSLPPVRVSATSPQLRDPDAVLANVERLVDAVLVDSILLVLAERFPKLTREDVAGWSDRGRRAVSTWIASLATDPSAAAPRYLERFR